MTSESRGSIATTQKRVLTRRGVMWLGQTCNQRCYFCYFINRIEDHKHPEHAFMSLDKAKKICDTLRYFYGNTSIDIQGGEPTIYKDIMELVRHCHDIGLYPTLITNGLMLEKPGAIEKYRDAGVRDFLVSLHGIGEIHDEVVRVKGAHRKIMTAIERMKALGIGCVFHYQPLHSSPYGHSVGRTPQPMPVTDHAGDCLVRLPLWVGLAPHMDRVLNATHNCLRDLT